MKKKNLLITLVLVLAAAVIGGVYLKGRSQAPSGSLAIVLDGSETLVDPFSAPSVPVEGTTVNGKGEEKEISETGAALKDVLALAGVGEGAYTSVRAVSSDEYGADLTEEEISSGDRAFLVRDSSDEGQETIRLIVFGDTNSKRQVKDVVRIEILQ